MTPRKIKPRPTRHSGLPDHQATGPAIMIRKTTTLAAALTSVALIFGLTACGASDSDCQGDPGKVTEKDYDAQTKTNTTADYELTILRADGTTYEKDVSSTAYDDWYKVGSKFPSSKHCDGGKAKD